MLIKLNPLESEETRKKVDDFIERNVNDSSANRFITSTLMPYGRDTIERITRANVRDGIEYFVRMQNGDIAGLCNIQRSELTGFDLVILLIDKDSRTRGLGQEMLDEIVELARAGGYRDLKTDVFADNKTMLRLLIKNGFIVTRFEPNFRADGMGRVELRKRT